MNRSSSRCVARTAVFFWPNARAASHEQLDPVAMLPTNTLILKGE